MTRAASKYYERRLREVFRNKIPYDRIYVILNFSIIKHMGVLNSASAKAYILKILFYFSVKLLFILNQFEFSEIPLLKMG